MLACFAFSFSTVQADSSLLEANKKTIKFGLIPYVSSTRLIKIFLPLKKHLERLAPYEIVFLTAPNFKKFFDRTQDQQYDVVFTAPHLGLMAEEVYGYQRLARFSRDLNACVFSCLDSKLDSLVDLKNKLVSTPDPLALVSVLGEFMLKKNGLKESENINYLRTPSHNNAIISVASNVADAGIVASGIYESFIAKGGGKKTKILKCSEPVPTAMFFANQSLDLKDRELLMASLLSFPESDLGRQFFQDTPFLGIQAINDSDMQKLEKYMDELKARL